MSSARENGAVVLVRERPGCLLQLLWFVFVGWWLGAMAIAFAYLMFLLIITIPLGVAVLNNIPEFFALRAPAPRDALRQRRSPAVNFLVRAVWFVVVGWWLAGIALALGYLLCLTLIGMPIGFLLFDATPTLLTLRRTA